MARRCCSARIRWATSSGWPIGLPCSSAASRRDAHRPRARAAARGSRRDEGDGRPDASRGCCAAVRRFAPEPSFAADQLIVPGPARLRPAVLDARAGCPGRASADSPPRKAGSTCSTASSWRARNHEPDALAAILVPIAIAAACSAGRRLGRPTFDAAHEPCRFCRMIGSNGRFAAQIVAPQRGSAVLRRPRVPAQLSANGRDGVAARRRGLRRRPSHGRLDARRSRHLHVQRRRSPRRWTPTFWRTRRPASRDADTDARDGRLLQVADVFSGAPVPWRPDE